MENTEIIKNTYQKEDINNLIKPSPLKKVLTDMCKEANTKSAQLLAEKVYARMVEHMKKEASNGKSVYDFDYTQFKELYASTTYTSILISMLREMFKIEGLFLQYASVDRDAYIYRIDLGKEI